MPFPVITNATRNYPPGSSGEHHITRREVKGGYKGQGWMVQIPHPSGQPGKRLYKFFSDSAHGDQNKSLEAAKRFRDDPASRSTRKTRRTSGVNTVIISRNPLAYINRLHQTRPSGNTHAMWVVYTPLTRKRRVFSDLVHGGIRESLTAALHHRDQKPPSQRKVDQALIHFKKQEYVKTEPEEPAGDFHGTSLTPSAATTALPGSEEKIRIMQERMARGESLHHPGDTPYDASILTPRQKLVIKSSNRTKRDDLNPAHYKKRTPRVPPMPPPSPPVTPPIQNTDFGSMHKAFRDIIAANPYDTSHRRIFGDWLEEQNLPDQALQQRETAHLIDKLGSRWGTPQGALKASSRAIAVSRITIKRLGQGFGGSGVYYSRSALNAHNQHQRGTQHDYHTAAMESHLEQAHWHEKRAQEAHRESLPENTYYHNLAAMAHRQAMYAHQAARANIARSLS